MAEDTITIVVDGRQIPARRDQTVIQAALDAGLYIPYLCYYPNMRPYGACRMCVVEVEGSGGTPASCTLPVTDGMSVLTNTPAAQSIRTEILELLVSEHPHGCLTCHRIELCGPQDVCLRHVGVNDRCVACPKNERCELKDTMRSIGVGMDTPLTYNNRGLQVAVDDPFYDRDYNLCIVCGRCVRACGEVRGDNAIAFVERAGQVLVGTSRGTSLLESGCEFCGSCIDACPVGALVEREYKWDKGGRRVTTLCTHCSVGCQVRLEVNRRNKIVRSIGGMEGPANRGQLCFKGKFGLDFPNHRQRLRRPLINRNGTLEEASWDEALALVAQRLQRYAGGQFALIADARSTNEENYLAQKFARTVMGTNNVDHASNLRPELVMGLEDTLGYMAATNPIWDLEQSGCIVVIGANVTEGHNVAAVPIKRAVQRGAKLIVLDPREVELTRYAHRWLRPRPGTEVAVLGGMLRVIVDEVGEDTEFARNWDNLHVLKRSLANYFDLERVEEVTGIPKEDIREVARLYARTDPAAVLYALDNVPQDHGTEVVHALADLALLTGNLGKPGGGVYPLRQGANEQGSWDVGCVPTMLPGYTSVESAEVRQRFAEAWNASVPAGPGLGLGDVFAAARGGGIKALWIIGDSPNFTNGELGDVLEAVKGLEFLVVQDSFLTEVARVASVVLPAATFAEEEGSYTNLERRVQLLRQTLELRDPEARPGWRILCDVAQAMGASGFDHSSPAQVLEEIGRLVPAYAGITWQRLSHWQMRLYPIYEVWPGHPIPQQLYPVEQGEPNALQWPCPDADHPGTPILYSDGFPQGKACFATLRMKRPSLLTSREYPLLFVPGRVLHDPDRDPLVGRENGLNRVRRQEALSIHPEDARRLGIGEGEEVEVVTDRGQRLQGVARLNEATHRGTVSATLLFASLMVELELSQEPDKMARVAGLPIRPARLEKVVEEAKR